MVTIRLSKNFVYDVVAHKTVNDVLALNKYHLFAKWTSEGAFFVTQQKGNAIYAVME